MFGFARSPFSRRRILAGSGGSSALDPDTVNYLNNLTGTIPDSVKFAVNDLVLKLKADGNWGEIDRLWLLNMPHAQNGLVNLVAPTTTQNMTNNGAVHTPFEGYKGNGTSAYMDTNYNPAVDGVKYVKGNSSLGCFVLKHSFYKEFDMGSYDGNFLVQNLISAFANDNVTYGSSLTDSSVSAGGSPTEGEGLTSVSCSGNTLTLFRDGVSVANQVKTTLPPSNIKQFLLGYNFNGVLGQPCDRPMLVAYFGSGLINQATFYDAIKAFVDSMTSSLYKGLIAAYNFDGDATSQTGNYNGVPSNITYAAGKQGLAAVFNNSIIQIGAVINHINGSFSVWVNPDNLSSNDQRVLCTLNGTFYFVIEFGDFVFYATSWQVRGPVSASQWSHFCFTWEANGLIKLYKDGAFVTQSSVASFDDFGQGFNFGSRPGGFSLYSGLLDMAYIWNRALSADEVAQVYNIGNGTALRRTRR